MIGLGGSSTLCQRALHPKINAFFGINGSGKTTLLRTLHSALRNEASIIEESPITSASVEFYSTKYSKSITRSLKSIDSDRAKDARQLSLLSGSAPTPQTELVWVSDDEGAGGQGKYMSNYLGVSRLYRDAIAANTRRYGFESTLNPASEDLAARELTLEGSFLSRFVNRWTTYSNNLLAEIRNIQQAGIGSILQTVLLSRPGADQVVPSGDPEAAYQTAKTFFDREPQLRHLTRRKQEFLNIYNGNPALRSVIRNIEVVEQNISAVQSKQAFLSETMNALFKGKQVIFTDSTVTVVGENGMPLPLEKLSTGEKQVLSLCVEVLSLEPGTVVFIDEPEMSLHIDWQRRLLNTLHVLNPDVQIIVATHSPEIMAEINDESIFRI